MGNAGEYKYMNLIAGIMLTSILPKACTLNGLKRYNQNLLKKGV
jgi:hypothetical protein